MYVNLAYPPATLLDTQVALNSTIRRLMINNLYTHVHKFFCTNFIVTNTGAKNKMDMGIRRSNGNL